MPNERIRELCGVTKGVNERIEESVLRLFSHIERMEYDMNVERLYVGDCMGSRLVWMMWIGTVNDRFGRWVSNENGV